MFTAGVILQTTSPPSISPWKDVSSAIHDMSNCPGSPSSEGVRPVNGEGWYCETLIGWVREANCASFFDAGCKAACSAVQEGLRGYSNCQPTPNSPLGITLMVTPVLLVVGLCFAGAISHYREMRRNNLNANSAAAQMLRADAVVVGGQANQAVELREFNNNPDGDAL